MRIISLAPINSERVSNESTEFLSTLLAKEMALYIKTRKSHWNISVESYHELHNVFKIQYEQLEKSIDEIVDCIAMNEKSKHDTMMEFSSKPFADESEGKYTTLEEMLNDLFREHETIIFKLRRGIANLKLYNNADRAGFLESLAEQHEKTAWTLRRSLILISIDQKCHSV